MTIIECFDKTPLENILTTLVTHPDKLIFVGRSDDLPSRVPLYSALLKRKHFPTRVEWRVIDDNLEKTVAMITEIIREEGDCIWDVTGGDELTLLALGIAYRDTRENHAVRLCRVDIREHMLCYLPEATAVPLEEGLLNIEDLIALHGGSVQQISARPDAAALIDDIDALWTIAAENNTQWNTRLAFLNELESKQNIPDEQLTVTIDSRRLSSSVARLGYKLAEVKRLLAALTSKGLITHVNTDRSLRFTYKNALVRKALAASGNILELKVLFEARDAVESGGPRYRDCCMGVTIDWDGKGRSRTNNEIDVIAFDGFTPLFISCKNGQVTEAEMYKLSAVAQRFGGIAVQKMLIVTDLPQSKRAAALQRAQSLGICLVPNAEELSKTQWRELFL